MYVCMYFKFLYLYLSITNRVHACMYKYMYVCICILRMCIPDRVLWPFTIYVNSGREFTCKFGPWQYIWFGLLPCMWIRAVTVHVNLGREGTCRIRAVTLHIIRAVNVYVIRAVTVHMIWAVNVHVGFEPWQYIWFGPWQYMIRTGTTAVYNSGAWCPARIHVTCINNKCMRYLCVHARMNLHEWWLCIVYGRVHECMYRECMHACIHLSCVYVLYVRIIICAWKYV